MTLDMSMTMKVVTGTITITIIVTGVIPGTVGTHMAILTARDTAVILMVVIPDTVAKMNIRD